MNNCCKNTDREIWRQTQEDYYGPSIHVTEQGAIGIKCGGHVIVATVQAWHSWGKEALLDAVDHAVPAEPPKPTGETECEICGEVAERLTTRLICDRCYVGEGAKTELPSPCENCAYQMVFSRNSPCADCHPFAERKNYTPKPTSPEHGQGVDVKQPALMICDHAGECEFNGCIHKVKHLPHLACDVLCQNKFKGIVGSACVPWVEPVKAKHYTRQPEEMEEDPTTTFCLGCL